MRSERVKALGLLTETLAVAASRTGLSSRPNGPAANAKEFAAASSLDQNGGVAGENIDDAAVVQEQLAGVVDGVDVAGGFDGRRAVVFDAAGPVAGEIAGDAGAAEDHGAGVEDSTTVALR